MFASDRTLLALEPMLFRDVAFLSQRLTAGVCSTSEATLTASTLDPDFVAAGVRPGHIITIDDVSYEVTEVAGADTLNISRLRESEDGELIPPSTLSTRPFSIHTFGPQLALAHTQVLNMLGLAPAGSSSLLISEDVLLNKTDFATFEARLALKQLLTSAGALSRDTAALAALRSSLDAAIRAAHQTLIARIDLNNDGIPDSQRRLNIQYLTRM